MNKSIQQALGVILLAILFSLALNQDRIIRMFYNDSQKHAVPIASNHASLGDDYHYYILATESLHQGIVSPEKIATTNNILLGALLVGGSINTFFHWLIPSSDIAVLASLIAQTLLLVIAFFVAIKTLTATSQPLNLPWLAFWVLFALIFVQAFLLMSYSNTIRIPALLSYYPNILRVINPQMGWAYGVLYLSVLVGFTKQPTQKKMLALSLMSIFFAAFSFSLALGVVFAISLFLVFSFLSERKIQWPLVLILLLLLLSVIYSYLQLHFFQTSIKGSEIGTGVMQHLVFKTQYLKYLLLILPLSRLYQNPLRLMLIALLISCVLIGAFCESIHLGNRLWIRGVGIYVWIMAVAMIGMWLQTKINRQITGMAAITVSLIGVFFLLPHQFNNNYSYVENDKWTMLNWINKHVATGSTILTDDLEFSFLLPIYTSAKPFVPLFSYSEFTSEEVVKRYYYALQQLGKKQEFIQQMKQYDRQSYADNITRVTLGKKLDENALRMDTFFAHLIYYPFTKFSEHAFDNRENKEHFLNTIEQWGNDDFLPDTPPQYVLIHKGELPSVQTKNFKVIFESNKMALMLREFN